MSAPTRCAQCGVPLPPPSKYKPRLYCPGGRCKQRAQYRRRTREQRDRENAKERERRKKRRQLARQQRFREAHTHCVECGEPLPPLHKYAPSAAIAHASARTERSGNG